MWQGEAQNPVPEGFKGKLLFPSCSGVRTLKQKAVICGEVQLFLSVQYKWQENIKGHLESEHTFLEAGSSH